MPALALSLVLLMPVSFARAATHSTSSHSDSGPVFVNLPLITLPIIKGGDVVRQITLDLTLELGAGVNEVSVGTLRPRLIEAYIEDLTRIYEKTDLATQQVDALAIKKRLQASSDRVLGKGIVAAVLIQQAIERNAK